MLFLKFVVFHLCSMLNHNSVLHSFMLKMYLKIKQQQQQKENVLTEQCHSEVSPLKVRESHHQLETPQLLHSEQPFFFSFFVSQCALQ